MSGTWHFIPRFNLFLIARALTGYHFRHAWICDTGRGFERSHPEVEQKSTAGLRFLWRSLQGRDEGPAKTTAVAVNISTEADAFIDMSREFDCLLILKGSIRLGLEWAHNNDVA